MNPDVTAYIQNTPEDQQGILKELRALIFTIVPNVNEQYKWSRPVYELEKDFCYIKTTKKHVTLGFFDFEKIKTNAELLEGTGKDMRHIKLNSPAQIKEYQVDKMIAESIL
jgi:hypothetical protein